MGAANKEGDRIGTNSQVYNGHLTQYTTKASSKKTGVSTTQSGTAGGETIFTSNFASDQWFDFETNNAGGDRSLSTALVHGDNAKYTNSASASKNKVQSSEQLDSKAAYILANGDGRNAEDDYINAHMTADNGNGPENGPSSVSIGGYSISVDTKNTQTTISQSTSSISAANVEFGAHADNAEGDNLNSFGNMENCPTLSGYSGSASSSKSSVSASQKIASISGNADPQVPNLINIGVNSQNSGGDNTYAGAVLQNFNSAHGYSGTTSSKKSQVQSSESFLDISALSGVIDVFTGGSHAVGGTDDNGDPLADGSNAGIHVVQGTLDKAGPTKNAYSASSCIAKGDLCQTRHSAR